MIHVTVVKKRKRYIGFDCIGHAGFAESGEDIVCAGVSALVINTMNSIGCLTRAKFSAETDEDTGMIAVRFDRPANHKVRLLMDSMILGLQGIQENYGDEYIALNFKEV